MQNLQTPQELKYKNEKLRFQLWKNSEKIKFYEFLKWSLENLKIKKIKDSLYGN